MTLHVDHQLAGQILRPIDDQSQRIRAALNSRPERRQVQRLHVPRGPGFVLLFAVRILPAVSDEVAVDLAAIPGQINRQRQVLQSVRGARTAERDVLQQQMGPRVLGSFPPALPDQPWKPLGAQAAQALRRGPTGGQRHDQTARIDRLAIQPARGPQEGIDSAQAVQVVVAPALRPGQPLRGSEPVHGDIGPQHFGQRPGLLLALLPLGVQIDQHQSAQVGGIVGRATVFVRAELPGPEHQRVQPAIAFVRRIRAVQQFTQQDQVGRVEHGDVRVTGPHAMPHATLQAERQQFPQLRPDGLGQPLGVPPPQQHGILHAELYGVRVGDPVVPPIPAEIPEPGTVGIAILHLCRQRKEPFEPLRVDPRLATGQGGREQIARAQRRVRLGGRDSVPQTILARGSRLQDAGPLGGSDFGGRGHPQGRTSHDEHPRAHAGHGGHGSRYPASWHA